MTNLYTLILMLWTLILSYTVNAHPQKRHPLVEYVSHDILSEITENLAKKRSKQIVNLKYDLRIDVSEHASQVGNTGKVYAGQAIISFDINPDIGLAEPVIIDFSGHSITSIEINGRKKSVKNLFSAEKNKIVIPSQVLRKTLNTIQIEYIAKYNFSESGFGHGGGLYKRIVEENGETFLFTKTEPFGSHKVYPCFDQPDLRANFKLSIITPQAWKAISAGVIQNQTSFRAKGKNLTKTTFSETTKISPYLFSFSAGPFKEEKYVREGEDLKLYYPSNLEGRLDAQKILATTAFGLDYYENLLNVPLPFQKYDQVIVPQHSGATEHVGAVLVGGQKYYTVAPEVPGSDEDFNFGEDILILHEIAHMWFGNLVSISWWDNLWLKESLATYLSFKAAQQIYPLDKVLNSFASSTQEALEKDKLPSSQPVQREIPSSEYASLAYDSITYSKGASIFRQLEEEIGSDRFWKVMGNYLSNNQKNSSDENGFLTELQPEVDFDTYDWFDSWFTTSGFDILSIEFSCDKSNRVQKLVVNRNNNIEKDTRAGRRHILNLDFLALKAGSFNKVDSIKLNINRRSDDFSDLVNGMICPDFVEGNLDSLGYFEYKFDKNSIDNAIPYFNGIASVNTRQKIFNQLRESVIVKQNFDAKVLANLAITNFRYESPSYKDLGFQMREYVTGITFQAKEVGYENHPEYLQIKSKYQEELLKFLASPEVNAESAGASIVDLMFLLDDNDQTKIMQTHSYMGVDLSIAFSDPMAQFGLIFALNVDFRTKLDMLRGALKTIEGLPMYGIVSGVLEKMETYGPAELALKQNALSYIMSIEQNGEGAREISNILFAMFPDQNQEHLKLAIKDDIIAYFPDFQARFPRKVKDYLMLLPRGCEKENIQIIETLKKTANLNPVAEDALISKIEELNECSMEISALQSAFN